MIPPDERVPGGPGEIEVWGHPWHGLVEDGVLTLPNAATMPHPGTTGGLGEADVLALAVPGTPAVTRTPAQAADDAAAGRQWLDYALISGRYQRHLYGQVIGGNGTWLYVAPDGSRWRATLAGVPGVQDLTAPWATTLTLARFGEIGAPAESHVLAVSLADWQQAIPGNPNGDYFLDGPWETTSALVEIEDVRRDGSAALLCVQISMEDGFRYRWGGFAQSDNDPIIRLLIGTIELTLTGTPGTDAAATLAVRRSRAAMLGTVSWGESLDYQHYYFTQDHTWVTDPGGTPVTGLAARVGGRTGQASHTGRVMAVGYDAAGQMREITLDLTEAWSSDDPLPSTADFPTRTCTGSKTLTATLSGPGGSVTVTGTMTVSEQSTTTYFLPIHGIAQRTSQVAFGPLTDTWVTEGAWGGTPPDLAWMPEAQLHDLALGIDSDSDGAWPLSRVPIGRASLDGGGSTVWLAGVLRYSATCLELIVALGNTNTYGNFGFDARYYHGAVSMAGAAVALQSRPAVLGEVDYYGTAHPVTGAIERVRDVPVVWV